MSTEIRSTTIYPEPTPFPEGWYFVASRQQLQKTKLIQKNWMGENIVAWCDQNGRVCRRGLLPAPRSVSRPRRRRVDIRWPTCLPIPWLRVRYHRAVRCNTLRRPTSDGKVESLRDTRHCGAYLRLVGYRWAGAAMGSACRRAGARWMVRLRDQHHPLSRPSPRYN